MLAPKHLSLTITMALPVSTYFVPTAMAHCDTMDGPVVADALKALNSGDLQPVLKWLRPDDEHKIRTAFDQVRTVRKQGAEAKRLADRFFLETLVRLHRAGEGEPFTGLKPAGTDPGPAVRAADQALVDGSTKAVTEMLTAKVTEAVQTRFERVHRLSDHADDSVEAGRAYVAAYVDYAHYVKHVHASATAAEGSATLHGHAKAAHGSAGESRADPIWIMEQEHAVIGKMIDATAHLVHSLRSGQGVDRQRLAQFHEFFVNFADRCHHVKEERYLFPVLRRQGADPDVLNRLIQEHAKGREILAAVGEQLGRDPLDARARQVLAEMFDAYVKLMRQHIERENAQVWPDAKQRLGPELQHQLTTAFHVTEVLELGPLFHEEYHAMAEKLIQH